MTRRSAILESILCVGVVLFVAACSSGGGGSSGSGGAPAAGAAGFVAGAPGAGGGGGGVPAQGGATGAPSGGGMSAPAGMLMCGGKLCHAGGRCAMDGSCPSFLGGCFSGADMLETCEAYCNAQHFACAAGSCNYDGSPASNGSAYTWVSYPVSARDDCQAGAVPPNYNLDSCATLIWLSLAKPRTDVVRCCCRG